MSFDKLEPRVKHRLQFKESNQTLSYLGDVLTLSDYPENEPNLPSSLVIHELHKYDSVAAAFNDKGEESSFILMPCYPRHDLKRKVRGLLAHLRERNKVMKVLVDHPSHKFAILVPMELSTDSNKLEDREIIHLDGFRCYFIDVDRIRNAPNLSGNKRERNDQEEAENHYNRLIRNKDERHKSRIFHMRNLNNWLKAVLIEQGVQALSYQPPHETLKVLDFGCGKGGDFFKWFSVPGGIGEYVGIDIAKRSLEDLVQRVNNGDPRARNKLAKVVAADMGKQNLFPSSSTLPLDYYTHSTCMWKLGTPFGPDDEAKYDIASCQFAIHYMFQTLERADFFFSQVSKLLISGGVFVATTIDCRVMFEKVMESCCGDNGEKHDNNTIIMRDALNNQLLKISFDNENWSRILQDPMQITNDIMSRTDEEQEAEDATFRSAFGIKYNYMLSDDGDTAAVDAPEWLVPLGRPLEALLARHDMSLQACVNFQEFVNSNLDSQNREMLEKMSVFDFTGGVPEADWEISKLYVALIFKKNGDPPFGDVNQRRPPPSQESFYPPPSTSQSFQPSFAPSSPEDPPPSFAPASPEDPPPSFAPSSPEDPPPSFAPSSPEDPPPSFAPSSPEGPPPSFAPSSPEDPPPSFAPSSPEGPPPSFAPSSPEEPPPSSPGFLPSSSENGPQFEPSSPTSSPPREVNGPQFMPTSPDSSPPREEPNFEPYSPASSPPTTGFVPSSPNSPPPEEEDEDEDMRQLMKIRTYAVRMAGGEEIWSSLNEDQCDEYMDKATDEVQKGNL